MKKKLLSIVMATVLVMTALLTGCGGGGNSEAENPEDRVLQVRLRGSITTLDWNANTDTHNQQIYNNIYEGLYGMDEAAGDYYNLLAEDVTLSDDQLTYTVKLREGVKFQNGDEMKASDVVFSYNRAMEGATLLYLTAPIESVEAVDDYTVDFHLKYAFSPIAHTFFNVKIVSEREVTEQGDAFGTIPNTAGTGAYYVTDYDVSTGCTMEAFEDYWGEAPEIKHVEYVLIEDQSAAVAAFENGELDYYDNASMPDWDALVESAGEENSELVRGNNIMWMGINYASNDVLANDLVREAMFYAINKEDVNMGVCDGRGTVTDQYMPSEYVATSPESGYETYDYDPDKARELLAEAGYPDGVDAGTILTGGDSTSNNAKMAQVLQANLAEVGINVEVQTMDISVVTEMWHNQEFDICVFSDSGNYDFNNIRQQVDSESVGMYCIKYKDGPFDWQRIEELVDLGASTSDVDTRLEYYTELWSIVMDTATILPVINTPVGIVWSEDLDIGDPVPTYYELKNFAWK